jgi:hypothetical protein
MFNTLNICELCNNSIFLSAFHGFYGKTNKHMIMFCCIFDEDFQNWEGKVLL